MKQILWIALVLLLGWGGMKFSAYYKDMERKTAPQNQYEPPPPPPPASMPASLEPLLEAAKQKGAEALRGWLNQYRSFVKEPRLSEIELDYVVMVGRSDPPEARRVFASVKGRNGPESPLHDQIKKLEKTYE